MANITLDGMEALVAKHSTRRDNGKTYSNKVNLVRYAGKKQKAVHARSNAVHDST
ncbi:MAG: hypothetical protein SO188_11635 [Prevotella sp.]|nr:hypothetical protein [Prevotella sp.]